MNVALCRVTLRLHGVHSLKEKRGIARSLIARVGRKFGVSVAEVEDNDLWQRLTLGVACVSNSAAHAGQTIDSVIEFMAEGRGETEVIDYDVEMVTVF